MRRAGLLAVTAAAAVLLACTDGSSPRPSAAPSSGGGSGPPSTSTSASAKATGTPSPSPSATPSARNLCPATYAAPDPDRPRVALRFAVSGDLTSVTGHETVSFTPDRSISELVFRLTANTAPTVAEGNGIRVSSAVADHGGGRARYERDGAATGSQGGLLIIPFATPIAAGTTVSANLDFVVTLGEGSFDRFGRAAGYAWFASAHPLLAWQRGYGWHTEPMIRFTAESATSEAADTDLTVTAPAGDTVLASGRPATPVAFGSGQRRWHSSISAARDVSVAVGPFVLRDTTVNGVAVRVGAGTASDADDIMAEERRAIPALAAMFGPFPFPTLSVALLPASGGGIEYPSSIFLLGTGEQRLVVTHETAHQWFYAMVGDSQAQHAWLDEAFASYAEQRVDGDPPPSSELSKPGVVDTPTASYGDREGDYYEITYDKGSAALFAARAAAGATRFDAALRCYVNANAWRIAVPADLATALRRLPAAVAVLTRAGALP